MALFTSIVDLDSIQVPSSNFKPEQHIAEIEALARTMLNLQASTHIPVVRSLGIDEYELVSDYLSYYAYLKARELDEKLPDRLMVFIMDAKNEADIRSQLDMRAKLPPVPNPDPSLADLDLRLSNLEGRVKQGSEQMSSAIAQLKTEFLEAIDAKLPPPVPVLPALEAFNQILDPAIAQATLRNLTFLGNKKAQDIVQRLQEFKQKNQGQDFKSFAEVLEATKDGRTRALSEIKMLEVIDRWN
jgi:hypothetical protein